MAPLTNAERQARYRERLKANASLDALGDRARDAVDQAIAALWAFFSRYDGGKPLGDVADFTTVAEWRASLAREPGALIEYCRSVTEHDANRLTADELAPINAIVAMADAISLAAERPEPAKRSRRK